MKKTPKNEIIKGGPNVLIRGSKCWRCGHEWRPKNINVVPTVCPACKSPYWDRPRRIRKDSEKR